jgi:hypothetical protein
MQNNFTGNPMTGKELCSGASIAAGLVCFLLKYIVTHSVGKEKTWIS